MKRITVSLISLAALVLLTLGASFAGSQGDCCKNGASCCKNGAACCRQRHNK